MPEASRDKLADLTCEILRRAGALSAQIPSPVVRARAASLVRGMNSYYSNLIEGRKTLPREMESALRQDYSEDPEKRANQHLSRAQIEAEQWMIERLRRDPELSIHSAEFLCWLHREFYQRLPEELHWSSDRSGKRYKSSRGPCGRSRWSSCQECQVSQRRKRLLLHPAAHEVRQKVNWFKLGRCLRFADAVERPNQVDQSRGNRCR